MKSRKYCHASYYRKMNRSRKRPIVFAVRDFPPGCGTKSDVSRFNLPEKSIKNPRTGDHVTFKNSRINHVAFKDPGTDHVAAAPKLKSTCFKPETESKNSVHDLVIADSTSSHRQETEFKSSVYFHGSAARKREGTSYLRQEPETHGLSPREKVLEVLRHFNEVFKQLDRDKRRSTGDSFDDATTTNRIDIKTQNVLEKMGKLVNTEKRIGSVPGIEVGDEFQYKTELRVVGLHFKTMCGIDYKKIGETKFATSIVASEGYGYDDKFDSDVVIYTGEGGNVLGKEKKYDDQKMERGNLALANSMRERREVRVIRGEERWDHKGKRYVYDGLYLVDEYWLERGASGKSVYKFKLCRIPGQPPLT